jgi:hypothetical protein
VNGFNTGEKPIGFRCDNLQIMADKLQEIIEGYPHYGPVLDGFRANMLEVRGTHSIERNAARLKASFTW